ncbi:hypothetical protein L249_7449 [Ophiocordyceps polyrhachis-furcata BCC 54312]|uniref:Uncharacterized protein n=1 Tax=Ophiocordyceps polyrhachis-furcata BCC 54312 TaxID=1330021 RepID=A0A367L9N0_9HYPO|nr:hypothetical protein L249_7449 [Ophiocordyceps polyrhachis-furcata BCC 54312]
MAPSAAPPDGAPGDTVGVPIKISGPYGLLWTRRTRPPFLLLLPVQSRNPSNRPYRRFYNPMRPGRNRPRPPYSLPPPPHYPRDHLSSNRY